METKTSTTVEQTIYEMLKTNTGTHMCDSGGDNGRMWQRNANKTLQDFKNEPEVDFDLEYNDYTISLFHYLNNSLELDEVCQEFNSIPCDNWEGELPHKTECVYGLSNKGADFLINRGYNGFKLERTFNSYNGESCLSQVIQGSWLEYNNTRYLLLQIHQGADVRGGYTDAKLFVCDDECALSESVYGTVTTKDGEDISVDNMYDGYSLTTEGGESIEDLKIESASLYLAE